MYKKHRRIKRENLAFNAGKNAGRGRCTSKAPYIMARDICREMGFEKEYFDHFETGFYETITIVS